MAYSPRNYCYVVRVRPTDGVRRSFPIDMLRYDRLCPRRETDSNLIMSANELRMQPPIELLRLKAPAGWVPTFDRWKSFGWQVEDISRTDGDTG